MLRNSEHAEFHLTEQLNINSAILMEPTSLIEMHTEMMNHAHSMTVHQDILQHFMI